MFRMLDVVYSVENLEMLANCLERLKNFYQVSKLDKLWMKRIK